MNNYLAKSNKACMGAKRLRSTPREVAAAGRLKVKKSKELHETDVALGRRLKSLRIRRGLSQTALGELLGLSFQQIQKYERGTNRIRVNQLQRFAEALAVPTTELLEIPRTDASEIAEMIDTRIARRLMDAFQSLTSRERRCLAALVEEMASRR